MNMDIANLAADTAKFLAPFLPYLIKGGKAAAKAAFEHIGEKFSDAEWDKAETLWQKIWPKAQKKTVTKANIEEAGDDIRKDPESEDARQILRLQLKKLLTEDDELRQFVAENINIINSKVVSVGRDMNASNAMIGDRNIVASHGGQISQIINNFVHYDKNSDPKILEGQLINYLKWVEDYFEFIELRGIEQGESPVIR